MLYFTSEPTQRYWYHMFLIIKQWNCAIIDYWSSSPQCSSLLSMVQYSGVIGYSWKSVQNKNNKWHGCTDYKCKKKKTLQACKWKLNLNCTTTYKGPIGHSAFLASVSHFVSLNSKFHQCPVWQWRWCQGHRCCQAHWWKILEDSLLNLRQNTSCYIPIIFPIVYHRKNELLMAYNSKIKG